MAPWLSRRRTTDRRRHLLRDLQAVARARRDRGRAGPAVAAEDFAGAMRAMAALRPAVDAFFDKVTVNADDPALRLNRLRLLAGLRRTTLLAADLSRVVG